MKTSGIKRVGGAILLAFTLLTMLRANAAIVALNANQTNYTLWGTNTYYVTGPVYLHGTTVIKAGAVVKYAPGASAVLFMEGIDCQTTAGFPALFHGAR